MKYCSWYFKGPKAEENAERFIREKLLNQDDGWYRNLGLNTLTWHLEQWGWVLKEKNIKLVLGKTEEAYIWTKERMQEQGTWDNYEDKAGVWSKSVQEVVPQIFQGRNLPDSNGTHGVFYWLVVSFVGRVQKGRRAKKIKEELIELTAEELAQVEPILYPLFYKNFFGEAQGRRFKEFIARIYKKSRGSAKAVRRHAEYVHDFTKDKDLKLILDEINIQKNEDLADRLQWTTVAEKVLRKHGWEKRSDGVKLHMILDLFMQMNLIIGDYYPKRAKVA